MEWNDGNRRIPQSLAANDHLLQFNTSEGV